MNYLSLARSFISLGLLRRYSYVSSTHIPWNQCFYMRTKSSLKPLGVSELGLSSVHYYSSRSKAGKSKMSTAIPVADKDKDAFFVVRKGDVIGLYKNLSDCQAQVGSSVLDPPISVYKGYLWTKDVEEYLSSVGLKRPLYSIRASDLKIICLALLHHVFFRIKFLHLPCQLILSETLLSLSHLLILQKKLALLSLTVHQGEILVSLVQQRY